MTAAHWHLVLNHIPLLGIIFGTILLIYGVWRNQEDVQKASLGMLAVAGLFTLAVYLTGEPAEELVEGLAGVSHDAIEAHEEFGIYALIGGLATSILSTGALLFASLRRHIVRWTVYLVLAVALLTTGLLGYTASLGGQIHHQELRNEPSSHTIDGEDDTNVWAHAPKISFHW